MARGDFDSESDIDIFIDTEKAKETEASVKKIQKAFEKSDVYEKWKLKGIKNSISAKIGKRHYYCSCRE